MSDGAFGAVSVSAGKEEGVVKKREIRGQGEYDYRDKTVLIIGAGLSGYGCVHLACVLQARPVLLEQNTKRTAEEVAGGLSEADAKMTRIVIGETLPEDLSGRIDLVVPSPGVSPESPLIRALAADGVPVISEIEFAYRQMSGRLIAITGTNGKTTTTTLAGEIVKACDTRADQVFVVGNIGYSFAAKAKETTADSVCVAEVSSFQLETTERFHANVSAVLNVTPDHLDRHHTMQAYAGAKERVFANQEAEQGDACVLNYADPITREMGEQKTRARVIWFSSDAAQIPETGLVLRGDDIVYRREDGTEETLLHFPECILVGTCNAENVMAAFGIAIAMGYPLARVAEVIRGFHPVAHRIEFVAKKGGVDYYNDSKATNPDAAIQGIRAMKNPTVLIAGGYDKAADYTPWLVACKGKVKRYVLIGQTAEKIAEAIRAQEETPVYLAKDYDDALRDCTAHAKEGDAVLLSPACASWGMFRNYEERGDLFKAYVNALRDEG